MTVLRLGTRGSQLALAQARLVADRLEAAAPGLAVELVTIATAGDRDQSTPLAEGERPGWFTTAIQEALQRGEVDIAVHSLKDLPTRRPGGLVIAAVPLREDPRDALVSRTGAPLRDLPRGSVVGTGSPRREAQLRELRPDLDIRPIRGNVETRIRKVRDGEYDAAVVALAGLRRLGLETEAAEIFGLEEMLPAPGQGALAVECRADDARARDLLARVDDPAVRLAVTAERSFLAAIEGGCSFPAAAYAEHFGSTLKLHALVASGGRIIRSKMGGPAETAAGLGRQLAEDLLQRAGLR
ncbi:hydroxymethylbilane synthase [Tepidiforma thermophila]|uniref:Porphobilinogen deaminase n=1 Tax=Tepidiforma thermophila (strain KCTC 52669 / CGMCC 1.13589 / G233) TaxID=2761530 RepID=A0A2A9HCM6_TEPT2|nr:hydroxymethylbilane synthase [Tepidiforma thermophila]PFG72880.1 hydroxymethylbilane synthase [Tepidiforma thermophila]